MAYQNINQYNFLKFYLSPVREISDISLASDEKDFDQEVVFSPLLIGENDGTRMPLKFDFNSSDTVDCINCADFEREVVVSENYWNPLNLDLINCGTITELCNVGLTGIDNGLVDSFSGQSIEINTGLYTNPSDRYSRYKYDSRFKMHPVEGFTTPSNRILNDDSYNYDLYFSTDLTGSVGTYATFNGGFFQGFYKVFGYEYEVLPERYSLGWSTEFLLRYRWTGDTSVGLNARYPENTGTFFYYGARAENKFYHYADGHPASDSGYTRVTEGLNCLHTCECVTSGVTAHTCHHVYQQSGVTSTNCSCGCACDCVAYASIPEINPLFDEVSNGMSLRLSGDTGNPRICAKSYRIVGSCETTGSCSTTGLTYVTAATITEWCSASGIFDDCKDTPYIENENWAQIDVVFERNTYLDTCDLQFKGGTGQIIFDVYQATLENNSISLIEPPLTQEIPYDPYQVQEVRMNDVWLEEKKYRMGKLKIYVNGKLFMIIDDFEEIIPRPLNTSKETQIGVAYNISLGGGTQGLHDNLTVTGCADSISGMTYQQDPECLPTAVLDETIYSGLTTQIHLEEIFGGSFIGDISAFRMYTEPLNASQIKHNFKILKSKYNLLDPFCLNCNPVRPGDDSCYYYITTETYVYLLTENLEFLVEETNFCTPTPTPTPTNTPGLTPSSTPTPTITPSITPSVTVTNTPGASPTPTPSVTQTITPSITPTITPTPPSYFAYVFAEPQDTTSAIALGEYMFDAGATSFFGFANSGVPGVNNYANDLILYSQYSGFTNGGVGNFITPSSQFNSTIRQLTGTGTDAFGCGQNQYTFGTIQVTTSQVNPNINYFYSIWIPLAGVGGSMSNMTVDIGIGSACSPSIANTIPSPTLSSINVTIPSGCAIPAGIYRVLWMPVSGLLPVAPSLISSLYFKGNSKI